MTSNKQIIPVLAVWMVTYNHERFIAQSIEAVLMQKTTFPIRLIIGEDCSTDNTRQICLDYREKHPDIITVRCAEKNNLFKNAIGVYEACFHSGAKYVALCEGDDYWTDPLKLQKQVDFLEANSEYVLTFHDAQVVNQNGETIKISQTPDHAKCDYSQNQLVLGNFIIPTHSICFRNVLKEFPLEFNGAQNGDAFLTSLLGEFGQAKYLSEIKPNAYRVHDGGVWSKISRKKQKSHLMLTYYWMMQYYKRIENQKAANHYHYKMLLLNLKQRKFNFPYLTTLRKKIQQITINLLFKL